MTPDEILRDKLRKIEALFAGAATPGEKAAAGAAAGRIRQRLNQAAAKEKSIEMKFSISDVWSRRGRLPCALGHSAVRDMGPPARNLSRD
jgi:hypothetical protein